MTLKLLVSLTFHDFSSLTKLSITTAIIHGDKKHNFQMKNFDFFSSPEPKAHR